jgi:hypothetical protein
MQRSRYPKMTLQDLEKFRAWAAAKRANGAEPPWAAHLYGELHRTLDALIAGLLATSCETKTGAKGKHLTLAVSKSHRSSKPTTRT